MNAAASRARPLAFPRSWLSAGLFAVTFATVASYWRPILDGYFFEDDFVYLYRAIDLDLGEFLFTPHLGHVIPLRNFLYLANLDLFGPRPEPFFVAILLTHALNASLLGALVYRLTAAPWAAALAGILWGLCPSHAPTLDWYAVYGEVLMTALVLAVLVAAAGRAARGATAGAAGPWLWCAVSLLAAASFGIGAAGAVVLPAALALLGFTRRAWARTIAVLLALGALYVFAYARYGARDPFGESALLELTRVDLHVDPSLRQPLARSAAVYAADLGATLLLVAATYGVIAVGRGVFYSRESSAWMATQSRYHYFGSALLSVALATLLAFLARLPLGRLARWPVRLGAGALAVYVLTIAPPIDDHAQARRDTESFLASIQAGAIEAPPDAEVVLENRRFAGVTVPFSRQSFPGAAAAFAIFFPDESVYGRSIHFAERDIALLADVRGRRRTGALLWPRDLPNRRKPDRSGQLVEPRTPLESVFPRARFVAM